MNNIDYLVQGRSQRSKSDEAKRGELSYLGIVIGMEIRVFRTLPGSFDSLLPRELRWPEGSGQIIFHEMSDEATASSASAWLRPWLCLSTSFAVIPQHYLTMVGFLESQTKWQ